VIEVRDADAGDARPTVAVGAQCPAVKGVRRARERGRVRQDGDAGSVLIAGRDIETAVVVEVRGGNDPAAEAGAELGAVGERAVSIAW
jgi:hypothetical protein